MHSINHSAFHQPLYSQRFFAPSRDNSIGMQRAAKGIVNLNLYSK